MYETYTTISGRVATDLRVRQTAAHGEVASFRVACNTRRRDPSTGQWADGATLFLNVSCWRKVAVAVAQTLRRGSPIIAHGHLRTNEYIGADGGKRSELEMTAVSIGLDLAHMPTGPASSGQGPGGPGGPVSPDDGWREMPRETPAGPDSPIRQESAVG